MITSVLTPPQENEFGRITFACDGAYVVPRNIGDVTKYPETIGPNQVCTIFGAQPGSTTVNGADYLNIGYSYNTADLWRRNFLVCIGWILFFQITQIVALDYLMPDAGGGGAGFRLFAKPSAEAKKLNDELMRRREEKLALHEKEKTALMDAKPEEKDPYVFSSDFA